MDALDNQCLGFIYSANLLKVYMKNYQKLGKFDVIEDFFRFILNELIFKASGGVFKKIFTLFLGKLEDKRALQFIVDLCD